MFANIADLIYLNYGILDTDLNGTISDTETSNFTDAYTAVLAVQVEEQL